MKFSTSGSGIVVLGSKDCAGIGVCNKEGYWKSNDLLATYKNTGVGIDEVDCNDVANIEKWAWLA